MLVLFAVQFCDRDVGVVDNLVVMGPCAFTLLEQDAFSIGGEFARELLPVVFVVPRADDGVLGRGQ